MTTILLTPSPGCWFTDLVTANTTKLCLQDASLPTTPVLPSSVSRMLVNITVFSVSRTAETVGFVFRIVIY